MQDERTQYKIMHQKTKNNGKKGSVEGETKSDENVVDELDLVNELDLS